MASPSLPDPIGFEIALEKFVHMLKSQHRSSSTTVAYSGDLIQLKGYLEDRRITQATSVQTQHLEDFVAHLSTKGYTPKSVSRKINSLKTFFKFLHQSGLHSQNPSTPLTHPKFENPSPRILAPDEFKSLRDACRLDIRVCAIVELLLQTGMRISELANLNLDDIRKTELYIRPLENNAARTIPLNKTAATTIQNYLAIRPQTENTHLFVTKTGRPLLIRNIRTSIDRYFKKAGLKDVKVNDLRHTFIAYQLKNGVHPEVIHKHVGHRRISSTEKYLDFVKITATATSSKLLEL